MWALRPSAVGFRFASLKIVFGVVSFSYVMRLCAEVLCHLQHRGPWPVLLLRGCQVASMHVRADVVASSHGNEAIIWPSLHEAVDG